MREYHFDWHVAKDQEIETLMRRAADAALDFETVDFDTDIEILVVDEQEIRELNCRYRQIDRVTDVLSFPLYENQAQAAQDVFPGESVLLGDMVLCLPRAEQQAKEYGHSLAREVSFLCVHSVLHLLGYDHETDHREETEMFRRQNEIMDKLGITRG